MSGLVDIASHIKSRQFCKAFALLKKNRESIDARTSFKLLRSLASQLKLDPSSNESESISEFLKICCDIVDNSQDILSDDTEFTQGILSLHYLATLLSSNPGSPDIIRLSETLLFCLRKVSKPIKDVESIAANFFAHVWSLSNKVEEDLMILYRQTSLLILVHGGLAYWNRVIEKLIFAFQEPLPSASKTATCVFYEFLNYQKIHGTSSMIWFSSLMQAWMQVVFLSESHTDHQHCTGVLKQVISGKNQEQEMNWLMELVLGIFGNHPKNFINMPTLTFTKELQTVFVRVTVLALNYSSTAIKQLTEKLANHQTKMLNIVDLLLFGAGEMEHLKTVVETVTQTEVLTLKMKYISRASVICHHLMKLETVSIEKCPAILRLTDSVIRSHQQGNSKTFGTFLLGLEVFAYNTGVHFYQKSEFSKAVIYFRKALEYIIKSLETEGSSGDVIDAFQARFSVLYDARRAALDWVGVKEDFSLGLSVWFVKDRPLMKELCKNKSFESFLTIWSKFKRDISAPPINGLQETSIVDLIEMNGFVLDQSLKWELLHEEFLAMDKRKGVIPKVALTHVAQLAAANAKTSLQKGISYYFVSRTKLDNAQKFDMAKKCVDKLDVLTSQSVSHHYGQIYLALAYFELFINHQELMKKKTEEEMESLGPLLQSNSSVEAPPGEDASCLTSDGTSLDAISYSYLKLELEFKNQDWMIKCLQLWEDLIQFGWTPDSYSGMIFSCLKSLGYFFMLLGNSFYSARVWSITLYFADKAKCDEEFLLAASEMLRLGLTLESTILDRCNILVETKNMIQQDQLHFHLCLAWFYYYQHKFADCWRVLDQKILQSPALNSDSPSKSILLIVTSGNLLRSLLAVLPEELSEVPPSNIGPIQAGIKAAQTSYTALKCYVSYAQLHGWDFSGQEWHALLLFLSSATNLARLYFYTASPREARFFLKEALQAAQRHVSVTRVMEALLELSLIDLMLDNTMDCQCKLTLLCHLMGVVPPSIPDVGTVLIPSNQTTATPSSPVEIRSDRRNRIIAKKVPEMQIQVQQDATHRMIQLPFTHEGTSPTTKIRELSDEIFPDHSTECICFICTSELVTSIRCFILTVQAKLWSLLGFQELAEEEFSKGYKMIHFICSRLRSSSKMSTKHSSKRLFDVPNGPKVQEIWSNHKVRWFQSTLITGLELMVERIMYSSIVNYAPHKIIEECANVKTILHEFYLGPLEHRMIKLASALCLGSLQMSRVSVSRESGKLDTEDNDVIIVGEISTPKTPAHNQRNPIKIPPPQRIRRNILGTKLGDTITIDEDDDNDEAFSRRRLGKPTRAILYSSDSDDDIVPPSPPLDTKPQSYAVNKNRTGPESNAKSGKSTGNPANKGTARGTKELSCSSGIDKTIRKPKEKTVSSSKIGHDNSDSCNEISVPNKTEKRCLRSKAGPASKKKESDDAELCARLASSKIACESSAAVDAPPKRTTRSTRK